MIPFRHRAFWLTCNMVYGDGSWPGCRGTYSGPQIFGWTFIAAGVTMIIGVCARLAATLSAVEMGLFLVLVWVPVIAAGSKSAGDWSETLASVALAAAAWVVAESYRGKRWVAFSER